MNLDHFDTILAFAAVMAGLSLVITALTQAVSGVLGLRGFNLKWGLEKLFAALAPGSEANAKSLVHHVLLHPLLSDSSFSGLKKYCSWWRYANHIRAEELSRLLSEWRDALNMPVENDVLRAARAHAIKALNLEAPLREIAAPHWTGALKALARIDVPSAITIQLRDGLLKQSLGMPTTKAEEKVQREAAMNRLKIEEIYPDLAKLVELVIHQGGTIQIPPDFLSALPSGVREVLVLPQSTEAEQALRAAALRTLDVAGAFLDDAVKRLATQIKMVEDGLTKWFDSSMDRVSQRFSANMRVVTIAGAAVVSLWMVVDSIDLWKQLARKPELRNKVIASSDALLRKADEMQVGSTHLPAAVYRVAANQLLEMRTNELAGFSRTNVNVITNLSSGTNWIVAQCKINGVTNITKWLEEYQALVPQASLRQAADTLQALLEDQLSLGVISSRGAGESWPAAVGNHFGGIMLSIVLLSLGAPFWFNLLRSLSNLRPVLASKDSQEEQARVKAIAAGNEGGE